MRRRCNFKTSVAWSLLLLWSNSVTTTAFVVVSPQRILLGRPLQEQKHFNGDDNDEKTRNDKDEARENVEEYRKGMSSVVGRGHQNGVDHDKIMDVVFKFGGSSLANADRIDHVARLIQSQIRHGYRPRSVVCSAMGKTTNNLLTASDLALEGRVSIDPIRTLHLSTMEEFGMNERVQNEIMELLQECEDMLNGVRLINELSPKSLDHLVGYGERCSARIMAARLNQLGVPAQAFDAWNVGIYTDSEFGSANLRAGYEETIAKAFERLDPNMVAVVTGFIGHDPNGRITTLGRGGSDLTATAIGAALDVDEIQVWKDVDGILTSDPRVVKNAIPVSQVTFEEASELAYFGAQVLHPIAMMPAMKHNVPVRVKNSYNPQAVGTVIHQDKTTNPLVTAITYKRNIKVMDIHSTRMLGTYGFLAKVFAIFEKHKLSVDVLASSEVSVSLTLDVAQNMDSVSGLMEDLGPYAEVTMKEGMSILTLIADVEKSSQVLGTVFRVLCKEDVKVEMMSQGASKVNISFIVPGKDLDRAMLQLHRCFFEDDCIVEPLMPPSGATPNEAPALP